MQSKKFNKSKKSNFKGKRNFSNKFRGKNNNKRGGKNRFGQISNADVSKFVNKVTIPETVEVFVPEHTFSDFLIDERLKKNIIQRGYKTPTPIQDKSIPEALKGNDVVGIANTGTGKTGAFLIPTIHKVLNNPSEKILVVVPTRELALQINDEFRAFRMEKMYSVCCVGGMPIYRQIKDLKMNNNFVIGTPGRFKDLIDRKVLDLSLFNTIVLDEADRMLDMGFVNDMRFMMSQMPENKQTLFFSATLSSEIEKLIKDFLKNPVKISVKTGDTSKNIEQDVVMVKPGLDKIEVLHDLLISPEFQKVLIFGRTKHGVEKLSNNLNKRGFKTGSIHGDKRQSQRQGVLNLFKKNQIQMLVATDVAARGLDIPDVSHVINYNVPATHEDYIHRIGRTGRGDKKGKALTLLESKNK